MPGKRPAARHGRPRRCARRSVGFSTLHSPVVRAAGVRWYPHLPGEMLLVYGGGLSGSGCRARRPQRSGPWPRACVSQRTSPSCTRAMMWGRSSSCLVVCMKNVWIAEGGREAMVSVRGEGDLVGELAAIDDGPRSTSVTTLGPVEALHVPRSRLHGVSRAASARRACDPADRCRTVALRRRTAGAVEDRKTCSAVSPSGCLNCLSASASGMSTGSTSSCRSRRTSWRVGSVRRAKR